jgi:Family of unknown function (DUF6152)
VKTPAVATVLGLLFLLSSSASAHHATAAQYDVSSTIRLKGTVARIEWTNPHIHVFIDVKGEDGASETWTIEFPAPGATIVAGLSKQLLAPGTVIAFEAYPAKPSADRSKAQRSACAKAITLSDGSRITFVVGI